MTNFAKGADSDYRYRTGATGAQVQVDVSYYKGRGIVMYVNAVTIKGGSWEMSVFDGVHVHLAPLARKSDKAIRQEVERIDELAPAIAEAYKRDKASVKLVVGK